MHIPSEILDLLVSFLTNDKASLHSARLSCKALHQCATKHMLGKTSQPSEIFVKGGLELPDDAMSQTYPVLSPDTVTVWTWIRLPMDPFHSQNFTKEFKEVLCAPNEYRDRLDRHATGGRLSTCWGRTKEDEDLVAIGMRESA